jgi:NitT/TauT family transport system permease protein
MSASGITVTAPGVVPRASAPAIWLGGLLAGGIWLGAAAFIAWLPDEIEVGRTQELALVAAVLGGLAVLAALASSLLGETGLKLRKAGPWLSVLGLALITWEWLTAKSGTLPLPFFASPQGLLEVYLEDWPRLGESVLRSLWLLLTGYAIGAFAGSAGPRQSGTGCIRCCG